MKKSVFLGAGLLALALSSHSAELFVNIHSSQAMAQGAGLVLAGQALAQKAPVRVLLCDAAGDIAVAAGETVKLQPGGLHVMLMGLKKPLKVGDTFALTLKFKQAKPQTVTVTVQTGADKMPAAMPHQHKHGHDHHKAMPPAH